MKFFISTFLALYSFCTLNSQNLVEYSFIQSLTKQEIQAQYAFAADYDVELYKVLDTGKITRIMLDNFELPLLREAVHTIASRFESEASGGVDLFTVREIAKTGVNFVSVGALTHSAGSLDLSLKVQK